MPFIIFTTPGEAGTAVFHFIDKKTERHGSEVMRKVTQMGRGSV